MQTADLVSSKMMRADQTFFFMSLPFKTLASRLTKSEKAFGLHTSLKIPATARRRLAAFDWLESPRPLVELGLKPKNK
jgi:hypothetical protein